MVAVTSGVLVLLLIVVAFAFCKPRLKEIKRRWRDFREDEVVKNFSILRTLNVYLGKGEAEFILDCFLDMNIFPVHSQYT